MDARLMHTWKILDEYEKRFARIRCEKRMRAPWEGSDRAEILQDVKEILAFDKIPAPEIKILHEVTEQCHGITVKHCTYRSWEHFYGTFSLYSPSRSGKCPLIFVCPGHAPDGRLSEYNQKLCFRLSEMGAYVICNDNIGQGSRRALGHWSCIAPFYCGLTLQGLIVQETLALIRYAKSLPMVDPDRIGACGNSGGGTLTAFLSALEPTLSAVASCGYPSEFHYIFQKEREHCACNLLPGVVGKLEMWELYSLRAPKPLFLEQGLYDDLFPVEYFLRNARKLDAVYSMMDAHENFEYATCDSRHPWRDNDLSLICAYFAKQFALTGTPTECRELLPIQASVYPPDAYSTAELAAQLGGVSMPKDTHLEDIFVPTYGGERIDPHSIVEDLGRGSVMRVLAQFEAVLSNDFT